MAVWERVAAQVLLQKTVWREVAVETHLRARNEVLAALSPELAAVPKPVFCWETVLKVRHRSWLLLQCIITQLWFCRHCRYVLTAVTQEARRAKETHWQDSPFSATQARENCTGPVLLS